MLRTETARALAVFFSASVIVISIAVGIISGLDGDAQEVVRNMVIGAMASMV